MLRHSLIFKQVTLPEHPLGWPAPFDLNLGLKEVLLIEGVGLAESEALLSVAATLRLPVQGQVWHWGKDIARAPRSELYHLRRQIAYITPRQVLLHRLTLMENIALGPGYYQDCSVGEVFRQYGALLKFLDLGPYLSRFPPQVPEAVYFRTLWARELVKGPELILAALEGPLRAAETYKMIFPWLKNYLEEQDRAAIIMGRSLKRFHAIAHRLLKLQARNLVESRFLEQKEPPLTAFLPLV